MDPYGGSSSRSVRNLHTVFHGGVPSYIPISSLGGFAFLHILGNICYFWSFS